MAHLSWEDFLKLIDGVGIIHMATASSEGEPHVAVVSAAVDDGRVLVAIRSNSGKAANLRSNPRTSLVWQGNSAETYLWGDVELVTDPSEKSRVWNTRMFPYDMAMFFGSADSPDWVIARVTPTRVVAMVQGETGLTRRVWQA